MQCIVRPRSGKCLIGDRGAKTESDLGDEGTPVCAGSIRLSS